MLIAALLTLTFALPALSQDLRGTGDLGLVIEREAGSLLVVDQTARTSIGQIEGLGDLSHATIVYAPDARHAYVFGRDGGLTKVDILTQTIVNRVIQGGNSIGGAISDDGKLIAVSNYEPGGVKVFDADTLELVADIPMESKTVGIADVPGSRFIVATWDTGEVWILDFSAGTTPEITRLEGIGKNPYDALLTGDGRIYIVGLFGEKGLTAVDLWQNPPKVTHFLPDYGKDQQDMPVYKMPHLQGWTLAEGTYALPAAGLHQLLWVDAETLSEIGHTDLAGQPVFAVARPDKREIWVNFAPPHNDTIQIVDTQTHEVIDTLKPGKGILHLEFTPRGREVWLSARDDNKVLIYDARSHQPISEIEAAAPSGIFFTDRAHRTGL
ncbi:MAG: cytochrome D1 domain-containing protein [Paracoccus sp. (in: a-proteobacteria)]|uniref:cytochrome D1 domain-containing protein n=1 Tax=Paracoccus sp. TaxID=267 RepID=UPI0026E0DA13|nr:cytochrome D1 domain-containing protein [Paracoccus sp. (in: a-proteobacteria)]MDO5620861.1 cytochrome D1 domain-containing protein [Paracoccus sp. (in: a-proteobacteria)]